jgi:hypothetical protein
MATAGILGMFVGATLLALGYQIFMSWVATGDSRKIVPAAEGPETTSAVTPHVPATAAAP